MRSRSKTHVWRRRLWAAVGATAALAIGACAVDVLVVRARTRAQFQAALHAPGIVLQLTDLTPRQREILLAVEDPAFYRHKGIDFSTPGAGLTTITQGLGKLHYFRSFRPGIRKLRLCLLARFALDPLVSKDDQLTLYVNEVGLGSVDGEWIQGFSRAARVYYGKSVADLSEDEYLSLVAMTIAPTVFSLREHPERNADRVAAIKRLVSGQYHPKGLMDVYYGGRTFRPARGRLRALYDRLVWGY